MDVVLVGEAEDFHVGWRHEELTETRLRREEVLHDILLVHFFLLECFLEVFEVDSDLALVVYFLIINLKALPLNQHISLKT